MEETGNESVSANLAYLRRRQLTSVPRRDPRPGTITVYIGDGQFHSVAINSSKTLRQVLDTLSDRRAHDSLSQREAYDFDGNPIDRDVKLDNLPVREILCLPSTPRRGNEDDGFADALQLGIARLKKADNEDTDVVVKRLALEVKDKVPTGDHTIALRVYPSCFLASDLVTAVQASQAVPNVEAVALCRRMEQLGLIFHAIHRGYFTGSANEPYCFAIPTLSARERSTSPTRSTIDRLQQFHRKFWETDVPVPRGGLPTSSQRLNRLFRTASFLPNIVLKHLLENQSNFVSPFEVDVVAGLIFADVSGFTALAERLSAFGVRGVEQLTSYLNDFFDKMIAIIFNHGGDIVKFAGDALVVIWPTDSMAGLQYSTQAAVQCALALQSSLKSYDAGGTPLQLHIGVGAGVIDCVYLGLPPRHEFFVAGSPLADTNECVENASPGEVWISKKAQSILGAAVVTKRHVAKSPRGSLELISLSQSVPLLPISVPIHEGLLPLMEQFIPSAVTTYFESGGSDAFLAGFRSVSIVFLGFDLPVEAGDIEKKHALEKGQRFFTTSQKLVEKHGGTIRQFIIDDKGAVMIVVFGLPPTSHEDDPHRAVLFALTLSKHFSQNGDKEPSAGITTGKAFCGTVGSEDRREYAVVGDVVNLSARLMSKANGLILCDRATYQATSSRFVFKTLPPVMLKGKQKAVDIFSPMHEYSSAEIVSARRHFGLPRTQQGGRLNLQSLNMRPTTQILPLVGRDAEFKEIKTILTELTYNIRNSATASPSPNLLCIEGEIGAGKTRLITELTSQARQLGLKFAIGHSYSTDLLTPFASFKAVALKALASKEVGRTPRLHALKTSPDESTPRSETSSWSKTSTPRGSIPLDSVSSILESVQRLLGVDWSKYAHALQDLVPEMVVPTEAQPPDAVSGAARAEKTAEFISKLLHQAKFDIIILENAQWMDNMSWWFATRLVRNWCSPQHLLVISFRTSSLEDDCTASALSQYKDMLDAVSIASPRVVVKRLALKRFDHQQVREFLAKKLGIPTKGVSDSVVENLAERTSGNPLALLETTTQFLQSGALVVVSNVSCELSQSHKLFQLGASESALNATIVSRLDSFGSFTQLLLKIAATIGMDFRIDLLLDVLREMSTAEVDEVRLSTALVELESKDVIRLLSAHPPIYSFSFKGAPMMIYKSMLFSQRKAIHQKIAEWLENNESVSGPNQAALAHHWKGAEVWPKALAFMSRVATRTWNQGAYKEAISLLLDCVEFYGHLDPDFAKEYSLQLGSWYRMLGEAFFHLRDFRKSQAHLDEALRVLKLTLPPEGANAVPQMLQMMGKRLNKIKQHVASMTEYDGFICQIASKRKMNDLLDTGAKEAVSIYLLYGVMKMYDNLRDEMAFCCFTSMRFAAKLDMRHEYIAAGSLSALVLNNLGMHNVATEITEHVRHFAEKLVDHPDTKSKECMARYYYCLAFYNSVASQWSSASKNLDLCIQNAKLASRPSMVEEAFIITLFASFWRGEFALLESQLVEADKMAEQNQDFVFSCMAAHVRTALLFAQNHKKTAHRILDSLSHHFNSNPNDTRGVAVLISANREAVLLLPLKVKSFIVHKNWDDLLHKASELLATVESRHQLTFLSTMSLYNLCEASLHLFEAAKCSTDFVSRSLRCMTEFASVFKFLQPALLMFEAEFHKLQGNYGVEISKLKQALELAREHKTKYIEACILQQIGDGGLSKTYKDLLSEMRVKQN